VLGQSGVTATLLFIMINYDPFTIQLKTKRVKGSKSKYLFVNVLPTGISRSL
jgi:hypothetical protein